MKINSIIDLVKDLDTSRQTKNLNKLLIRILLHLQVEFSYIMSDDYKNILSNFTIPTNWAGFYPQNDVTNKQYRSEIMLEKRSGVQLDGQDLGELWSFSVRSIAGHGDEPLTFYGVGCQWSNDGVNRNWLLLACYNPKVTGWLVRGNNASLEHNGAGANNTRNVRFKKSSVEYIYQ